MPGPVIAQKSPYLMKVEAGTYMWCACGKSATQPFCDGSHSGTGISPVVVTVEEAGMKSFCGCKKTKTPPYCDGTHGTL